MRVGVVAAIGAVGLLVLAAVAWLALSPGWAVELARERVQDLLGRELSVKGGAHLTFSPLAIRFDDVALAGTGSQGDSFVTASTAAVPLRWGELLSRQVDFTAVTLEGADVALLIDEQGTANWVFPPPKTEGGLNLTLDRASIRYFDARNGQSLRLGGIDGSLLASADGSIGFEGRAVVNGRIARIDANLKSLARIHEDGSPVDVAVEAQDASASFSGRIATAKVLSLTGPLSLTSPRPAALLQILGLPVPAGGSASGPLNLDAGLDSAGRAYALRNAALTVGGFHGAGDMVFDLRNTNPKLQADLKTPALNLGAFIPASGASAGDWGRVQFDFGLLRSFDADVRIDTDSLRYGPLATGPARLSANLAGGKLNASGAARLAGGGTVAFRSTADATQLPAPVSLNVKAENTELEPLLAAVTGTAQITGRGTLAADLAATGETQEEMIGTLKGTASITLDAGHIAGADLGKVLSAASRKIQEGWEGDKGGTAFTALSGTATLADGIATINQFALDTPSLIAAVAGHADLLRRAVDLSASVKLKSQGENPVTDFPVPIIVKGSWARPNIYPDIDGILLDPAAGFAKLKAMGVPAGAGN